MSPIRTHLLLLDTSVAVGHICCSWTHLLLLDTSVAVGHICCSWTHLLLLDTSVALATLTLPEGLMVLKSQPRQCAGLGLRYHYLYRKPAPILFRCMPINLSDINIFLIAPPGEYQCEIVKDRRHLKRWGSQFTSITSVQSLMTRWF